jgi:hypothetical protein
MYVDMESRAGNVEAKRYLEVWRSLPPRERNTHLPEQICELASIAASDLIRWVSGQLWIEGSAQASMCLSSFRSEVLESTAKYAIESPENFRHAALFAKVAGMTPQPARGGVTVPIFNMPSASAGAVAGVTSETSPGSQSGVRSMDEEIVELSKVMQLDGPVHARAEDEVREDEEDEEDEDEGTL